ncbi:pentapeptide repeat-containing protein [Amycolatopsis australiensis]|uniref:Pentapeptide repeat-containing protein n=1 Tax=Amycolatopsis australiensis TaxID=546364 RepID=A0A1K1T2G9_9PSEU|nr:pentapeptide repeat-containing protein [Amycolatopsis australiensis]SFW90762.1 Pentapeptide repeat-containing protein [Amycolatopsis australiensis]
MDDRPRLRLSLGLNIVLLLAVAVVAAAGLGALLWLLLGRPPIRQAGGWTAADSFDFAKIVLAVVGGVGAVVALVVAYRKQQLGEAAERREDIKLFAERFTKASDQLGSDKAAVRLAGVYALEDLAQGTPAQRQTIVNVLCAYLRMPYLHPVADRPAAEQAPGPDREENERRQQELQVRLTAQRILRAHLRPADPAGFWRDLDLDLTDAKLADFDFGQCQVRTARFRGAEFTGRADFAAARFGGDALFGEATFLGPVEFGEAVFGGSAAFGGAGFRDLVRFSETRFGGDARFDDASFAWLAGFDGAAFGGVAGFDGARFDEVWFTRAQFGGPVRFSGTTIDGPADFTGARIRIDPPRERVSVRLGGVEIDGDARLTEHGHVFPGDLVLAEQSPPLTGRDGTWAFLQTSAGHADPEASG